MTAKERRKADSHSMLEILVLQNAKTQSNGQGEKRGKKKYSTFGISRKQEGKRKMLSGETPSKKLKGDTHLALIIVRVKCAMRRQD